MRRPAPLWIRMMPTRVVVGLATLGPVGRVRKGPGTAGTVAGILWFTLFFFHLPFLFYVIFAALAVYLAVLICGEAEERLAKTDPPEVVLDEFVAVPLCFAGLQPYLLDGRGWAVILAGFLLFRFFDILKPLGIGRLQKIPGGAGVVLDDVAAAGATCLCLHLIGAFTPWFVLATG